MTSLVAWYMMPPNFMNKRNAVSIGLESLAVALIISPEPVSTVLGISLLGYTRLNNQQTENKYNRHLESFDEQYEYKINIINKSTINYNVYTTRPGQLPVWSNMVSLCDRPEIWKSYRTNSPRKSQITTSNLQPAGLLGAPKSKNSSKFIAPKKPPSRK